MRPGDLEVVRLWLQSGGAEGPRHLPQAGGLLDQAALMMDAFSVLTGADIAWRKTYPPATTSH